MSDAEEIETGAAADFVAVSSVGEFYSGDDIDNALDDLSKQHTLFVLPTLVFVAVVMILGLAGNTLAFLVYYKHFPPSPTRSLNLSLSAVGLVASAVCCPGEIAELCMKYTFHSSWLCRAFRVLKGVLTFLSAFLLVAVAVYRNNTVCSKSRRLWTTKDARVAVVVSGILAITLSSPLAVLSGRHTTTMMAIRRTPANVSTPNVSIYTCGVEDAFVGSTFVLVHNVVMAAAYVCGVVVMTVSYVRIARHVLRRRKRSSQQRGQRTCEDGACIILPVKPRAGFHVILSTLFVNPALGGGSGNDDDAEGTSRAARKSSPMPTRLYVSRDTCTQEPSFVTETSLSDTLGTTCSSDDITEVLSSNAEILLAARVPQPGEETGLSRDHQKHDTVMTRVPWGSPSVHCESHNPIRLKVPAPPRTAPECGSSQSEDFISDDEDDGDERPEGHLQWSCPSWCQPLCRVFLCFILNCRCSIPPDSTCTSGGNRRVGRSSLLAARTVRTLIILILVSAISYLPFLLILGLRAVRLVSEESMSPSTRFVYELFLRSYFISISLSSIVYGWCSGKFRSLCRAVFSDIIPDERDRPLNT